MNFETADRQRSKRGLRKDQGNHKSTGALGRVNSRQVVNILEEHPDYVLVETPIFKTSGQKEGAGGDNNKEF